jgi:AcrR family transcriptional regulator
LAALVFITMAPKPNARKTVTSTRSYRSDLRRQQAEQTRSRIVNAAAELFAAEGYARTTLAKIASAAGVSAETVQGHGPKAALMIAALEQVAIGVTDEGNVLNLDAGRAFLRLDDPDEALDYLAAMGSDVNEQAAPLAFAVIGAAASDPELSQYLNKLIASITGQCRRILTVCRDRDWLREDVPFNELVETTAVLTSVDTYLRMTHYDGWSVARYRRWVRRMVAETIFRRP